MTLIVAGVALGDHWALQPSHPALPGLPDRSHAGSADSNTIEVTDLRAPMAGIEAKPPDSADTAVASPPAPLPELSIRLIDVRDELSRRVAAGDPQAACRLALSLSGCVRVDQHRSVAEQDEDVLVERLARAGPEFRQAIENQIKSFLTRQQNAQRWVAHCEGSEPTREEMVAALRVGTELGNLSATERYLQFMTLQSAPYLLANPAEAGVHRDTLRRAVARMLRERDPALLPWIALLTSQHMGTLFTDLLPEPFLDPEIGVLAYRLASRDAGDLEVQYPRGETPAPETLARAEAAYREYFVDSARQADRLARMKRSRTAGFIDQDVFDRLQDCAAD